LQMVLSKLRKQISLICLLLILKISKRKHGFRFILDTLYVPSYHQLFTISPPS